jgi:hypothetical protein
MKRRIIKTPSSTFIRPGANKLLNILQQRVDTGQKPVLFNYSMDDSDISNNTVSYATKEFDIRYLGGQKIIIFGAGSVGGYILWNLATAQLKVHLFDSKKVEFKHTQSGRTIYNSTHVGKLKVHAAKEIIENNFIGTKVLPSASSVAEIPDTQLIEYFKDSVLVVLVIDAPRQIERINRLAYNHISIVQAGVHRQGKSGHVAFTIKDRTPCLACTLGISSHHDIHRLDSEPAAGIDISIISQQTARVAMELMQSRITGKPITRWKPDQNFIYISNTRQDITPDGPGMIFESSKRRSSCSVCH